MNVFDAILTTIKAAEGSIAGRTAIQKLVYFEHISQLVNAKYRPHYYGPYSAEVAGTIQELIDLDFLKEEVDTAENTGYSVPEDWKRYRYSLSADGVKAVEQIKKENSAEYTKISNVVSICNNTVKLDTNMLSWAAKVHYILSSQNRTMVLDEIPHTAKSFGWTLSQLQINKAAELLRQLKLVT